MNMPPLCIEIRIVVDEHSFAGHMCILVIYMYHSVLKKHLVERHSYNYRYSYNLVRLFGSMD